MMQGARATAPPEAAGSTEEEPLQLDLAEKLRSAPELRLIGRRIRLKMEEHAYEGLVSYVTKTTVVLMSCEKLTFEQLEFRARESPDDSRRRRRRNRRGGAGNGARGGEPGDDSPTAPWGGASVPEASTSSEAVPPGGMSSSALSPDIQALLSSSIAAYPYCTFVRRRIHDVRLLDNRDADPTDTTPEIQLLRAHVRRFLIHNALGNTNGISMEAFLNRRLGWCHVDRELVASLTEQEQATVERLANEVSKERIAAQRTRAANAADASTDPTAVDVPPQPRDQPLEAPAPEEDAGRLPFVAVGLHTRTMYTAVLHLVMAIIVLLYAAVVFSTAEGAVVSPFISGYSTWIAGAATLQLLEAAAVGIHSLRLRIPVSWKLVGLRVLAFLVSFGFLIPSIYVTSSAAFTYYQPFTHESSESIYRRQVAQSPQTICTYSAKEKCGGWRTTCTTSNFDPAYCPTSCAAVVTAKPPCAGHIDTSIQNVAIPVCVFQYVAALVFFADFWFLCRFFYVAKHPEEVLTSTALRRSRRQREPIPDT